MPLLIKTTGLDEYLDPSGEAFVKVLIMGEAGSGKTPFGATWPKPIFADCEDGLASIARLKMPYARIRSSADMDALIDHLRRDNLAPVDKRKYRTLVVDTFDTYQRALIEQRKKSEGKEGLSGWQDWGWLDGKMIQFIENIINLKMHVVVNLHTKDHEEHDGEGDNKTTTVVRKARLKGDIKDGIWQDFDLIGQIEKFYEAEGGERVTKRRIRWHSEPQFPYLRDRFNVLPRFTSIDFEPTDFQQIFDAIANSLDDVPESSDLESIETDEGVAPAGQDLKGGAVAEPELPKPKPAAKKAAAKKAAAKKVEPESTPDPVAEEPAATPVPDDADAAPVGPDGKGTADEPVILPASTPMATESRVIEATDHIHSADGTCLKNTFGPKCGEVAEEAVAAAEAPPEPESAPEPEATPAAPERKAGAKHCGDQPPTMAGKYPAVPGCGVELNATNGSRAQIAMLKKKTFLCDQCHDAA